MVDESIDSNSQRRARDKQALRRKDQTEPVFADQIVQTRKAIESARVLLKQVGKPRSSK